MLDKVSGWGAGVERMAASARASTGVVIVAGVLQNSAGAGRKS
jgi:hypothetical protein